MTQQYKWLSTVAQMKVLAAELIRAAEIMGGDDEESQDVELILAVAPAGTVLDDDHAVNDTPVLTVSLAEYPEEGGYPVDPHDPTGGRIDAPCLTCGGHGMVGGWTHSGANPAEYDAEPCPDCNTPPASAQDDAKDEPAITIAAIDEYGPQLHWNKHWVEFGVGAKFYAAPAAGDARLLTRALDLLERNKPFYGQIGSRDVDVGASLKDWEEITTEMRSAIAASQQQEG